MALNPFGYLITGMLDTAVERLRNDLDVLKNHSSHLGRVGLYITHDDEGVIEVYGDINYKAYVPKKYDGWEVQFWEWNGTDDITIDLDDDLSVWDDEDMTQP